MTSQSQPQDGSWLGWATTTVIGGLSRFYSSGSKRRSDGEPAVSPRSQRPPRKQRRVPTSTDQTFDAERSGDAFHPQSAFRHRRNNAMHVTIDESMEYRDTDGNSMERRSHPATPHPSMFIGEAEFNTSMNDDGGNMTDGDDGLTPASGPTPSTPSTPAKPSFDVLDAFFVPPTPTPAADNDTPTAVNMIDDDDAETPTATAASSKKQSTDAKPTPKQDKDKPKVVPITAAEPKQKQSTSESWPTPASVPIGVPADTLDNVDIAGMNNEDIRKMFNAASLSEASSRLSALSFSRRPTSVNAYKKKQKRTQGKSPQKASKKKSLAVDEDEFSESDDQSEDPDFDEIDESIKKAAALSRPNGHVPSDGTRNKSDRRPVTPLKSTLKAPPKRTVKSPLTGKKRTKRDESAQFEGESPGRQGKTTKRAKKNDAEKHGKDSDAMDLNVSTEDKAAIAAAIASDPEDVDDEEEGNKESRSQALVVVPSKSRTKRHTRKKGKHSDGNWWKDKRGMYCKYDAGHPNFIRVSETDWRVIQYEAMDPNVRLPIDSLKSLNESLNGGSPLPASYFRTPKSLFDLESDVESVFDSERDQSDADGGVSFDRDALQRVGDTRISVIDDDDKDEMRRSRSKRSSRHSSYRRSTAARFGAGGRRHRSATRSSSKRRRSAYEHEPVTESGSEDEFDEYLRWKSRVRRGKRRRLESDKTLLPAISGGSSIDSPQNLAAMAEALRGSGLYAVEMKDDDAKAASKSSTSSSSTWSPDTKPPSLTDINKAKLESEEKDAAAASALTGPTASKASFGSSSLLSGSSSSSSLKSSSIGLGLLAAPNSSPSTTSSSSASPLGGLGGGKSLLSGASALGSLSKPSTSSASSAPSAFGGLGGPKPPAAKKKRSRSPSAPESKEEDEKASSGLWRGGLPLSAKKPAATSTAEPAKTSAGLFNFSSVKHVPGGGSVEKLVKPAKADGDDEDDDEGNFAPGADDDDSSDSDTGLSTPAQTLSFDSNAVEAFGKPKNTFAPVGFAPLNKNLPSGNFSFSASSSSDNKKDKDVASGEGAGDKNSGGGGLFSGSTSAGGGFGGFGGGGSGGSSLFSTNPLTTSASTGANKSVSSGLFGNASGSGGSSWDTPSFSTKSAYANHVSAGSKSSADESNKKRKKIDFVDFIKTKPKPNFGKSNEASAGPTKASLSDLLKNPKMTKGYDMPKSLSARAGESDKKKVEEDKVDKSQQDFLQRIKPVGDLFEGNDYSIDNLINSLTGPGLGPVPSTSGSSTASASASNSASVPSSTSAASISVSSSASSGKLSTFNFANAIPPPPPAGSNNNSKPADAAPSSASSLFGSGNKSSLNFGSFSSQPKNDDAADTAARKVQGADGTGGLKISFSNTSNSSKPKFPGAETPRDTSSSSGAGGGGGIGLSAVGASSSSSSGSHNTPSFGSSLFGKVPASVKINGGASAPASSGPFSFANNKPPASSGGGLYGTGAASSSSILPVGPSAGVGSTGFSFNGLSAATSTAQQKSSPFTEVPNTDSNGMKTDDSMASGGMSGANGSSSSSAAPSTSLFGGSSSSQSFAGTFGQTGKGPLGSGIPSGLGSGFGIQANGAGNGGNGMFANNNSGLGGLQGATSSQTSSKPTMFGARPVGMSGLNSNLIDPNAKAQMPASMLAQPMFRPSNKPLFAPNDPNTQVPSASAPFSGGSAFGHRPFTMNPAPVAAPTAAAGATPFSMGGGVFSAPNPTPGGGIGGASPFTMGGGLAGGGAAPGAGVSMAGGFAVGTANKGRKIYRGRRRAARR